MNNMTREAFEKLVEEGIALVPEKFLAKLDNVAVVIEDRPSAEQLRKMKVGKNYVLFGLYEGIPLISRTSAYGNVLPDKITIFQKTIEGYAETPEEVRGLVRDTVWHELAHHFGSDEKGAESASRHIRKKN
jgi:predicted Zn-dependent protease with MMP-like domain